MENNKMNINEKIAYLTSAIYKNIDTIERLGIEKLDKYELEEYNHLSGAHWNFINGVKDLTLKKRWLLVSKMKLDELIDNLSERE